MHQAGRGLQPQSRAIGNRLNQPIDFLVLPPDGLLDPGHPSPHVPWQREAFHHASPIEIDGGAVTECSGVREIAHDIVIVVGSSPQSYAQDVSDRTMSSIAGHESIGRPDGGRAIGPILSRAAGRHDDVRSVLLQTCDFVAAFNPTTQCQESVFEQRFRDVLRDRQYEVEWMGKQLEGKGTDLFSVDQTDARANCHASFDEIACNTQVFQPAQGRGMDADRAGMGRTDRTPLEDRAFQVQLTHEAAQIQPYRPCSDDHHLHEPTG